MNILFLTDNFVPESNAPAIRTFEHARKWITEGHKVTVITCAPNFPEGVVYPGYKNKWLSKETIEGIDVIRVKTYMTANEGVLKRTLDYVSFMFSSFIAGVFVKNIDVVIATSPQFFCVCSGFALAKLKRKKFVFELRDLWPESIKAVGAINKSIVIRFFEIIEQYLYRKSDLIISVTNSFKVELVSRGIEENRICVVRNGVDLNRFYFREKNAQLEELLELKNKLVIGYIGTQGLAHGLTTIVEAASKLQHRKDIVFMFVGCGAANKSLVKLTNSKALNNILFIDRKNQKIIQEYWSLCDLSVVHLKNIELFKSVIPSKLFESMAMGIPIILGQPKGESTDLIESTGTGTIISPECADEMAVVIEGLCNDISRRQLISKKCLVAVKQFERDFSAIKMLRAVETLIQKNGI